MSLGMQCLVIIGLFTAEEWAIQLIHWVLP